MLIAATAASQVGDWLYNAALLGYVYNATHSAAWVAVATICRLLPFVVLGPFGGAVADRYPRRTVLVVGCLVRLALMIVLAAVVAGRGPVALVIGIVAVGVGGRKRGAAGNVVRAPAAGGRGSDRPRQRVASHGARTSRSSSVRRLARCSSPPRPRPAAFLANGATFAVSALLFSTLGGQMVRTTGEPRREGDVVTGLRTARATPFVIPLFVLVAMVEFTYGAQTVQLVVYASRSLGLGHRRLRAPARGIRRWRAHQRGLQRSTRDQPPPDARCGERGGPRVRHPIRVCEHRSAGRCAAGDRGRRRGTRLL